MTDAHDFVRALSFLVAKGYFYANTFDWKVLVHNVATAGGNILG